MAKLTSELPEGGMDDIFEELSQVRKIRKLLYSRNLSSPCIQTLALLQSESVIDFLDPDIRDIAYPRVQGKKLSFILVKMITYHNSVVGSPRSPNLDFKRKKDMVSGLFTFFSL